MLVTAGSPRVGKIRKDLKDNLETKFGIKEVFAVAGRFDFAFCFKCEDWKEYRSLIEKVRGIPGVTKTETLLNIKFPE